MLDGAWGTMIHGAGPPARRTTAASASRRTPSTSPATPTCSTSRGPSWSLDPRALPRRRRRHHDDEHLHGDLDRPGRLRARERRLRAERRGRADRARGRAATAFVAGSVGPLNVTLSLSPRVDDPSFRTHTFDQVKEAYAEQIAGLAEGGVDLLLLETIFDTLNAKAAIAAARETAPDLPLWISATIVDLSGRTLSGQTIEAFWISVEHAEPLIVGVNCSLGASEMRPYVAELARVAPCLVAAHPNAGLPNAFGGYDETPELTSALLGEFAAAGLLNVAGSCCGSTPEHTRAIAAAVRGLSPRRIPSDRPAAGARASAGSSRSRSAPTPASR